MPSLERSERVACVVGGSEVVRALGAAEVRSIVVGDPSDPIAHSRFAASFVPKLAHRLPETLLELAAHDGRVPLPLFFDRDADLLAVSRARSALAPGYRFLLPEEGLVEDLVDKRRFQVLAERLGLPVPRAVRVHAADTEPAELGIPFPLILKAVPYRDERWESIHEAAKVLHVEDATELHRLWPRLAAAGLELLAQEAVPGTERDVLSHHVYVDTDGRVAGEFTGRKIRTYPARYGVSTALETTADPGVASLGREIVERLGLRGPAKLDFKQGPDGRLHLLEVNPRFTLWVQAGAIAGVNLPAIAHADLTGAPAPAAGRARPGVRWISPRLDVRAAREQGMPLRRWAGFALRCESNPSLAWDDLLGPLAGRARRAVRGRLGRGAARPGATR